MVSSGDLLADRRYTLAAELLAERDYVAAADLARQIIELAPRFGPAWFLLGEAEAEILRGIAGEHPEPPRREDVVAAFQKALELDPADSQGARVRLAAFGVGDPLTAVRPTYVQALFDEFAPSFDRKLTESLNYCAPRFLRGIVTHVCTEEDRPLRFVHALDVGCGTGLVGIEFRDICEHMAGVDLSPGMVRQAKKKRLYEELSVGDLVAWLEGRPPGRADLLLSADVFIYLGDLGPAFAGAARALMPRGLFAFTVQAHDGDGIVLGPELRYSHGERYLRDLAARHGFRIALLERASTRLELGEPVPGFLVVLEAPPCGFHDRDHR